MCPCCGCKTKQLSKRLKVFLSLLVVALVVVVVVAVNNNAWKKSVSVKYVGYEEDLLYGDVYVYEITNISSDHLNGVYAVIYMQAWFDDNEHYVEFEFENIIATDLSVGETIEYKLSKHEIIDACKEACPEGNEISWRTTPEIVKITWR